MDPELKAALDGINARLDGLHQLLSLLAAQVDQMKAVSRISQNEQTARVLLQGVETRLSDSQRWLDLEKRLTLLERAVTELRQHSP